MCKQMFDDLIVCRNHEWKQPRF